MAAIAAVAVTIMPRDWRDIGGIDNDLMLSAEWGFVNAPTTLMTCARDMLSVPHVAAPAQRGALLGMGNMVSRHSAPRLQRDTTRRT